MHSPGFRSGVQQGMINGASSNNIENVGGKNPLNLEWVVHQTFIDQGTDINSNKLENCLVFVRYLWRLTQFFLWRLWSLHFFSLADCMGPANRGSVSRGLRSLCCDAGLRDEGKSGAAGGLCQSLCFVFDISNSFSNVLPFSTELTEQEGRDADDARGTKLLPREPSKGKWKSGIETTLTKIAIYDKY